MSLTVHNLSFAYRPDRPILRDLSITFAPGRLTAVVGPNGAGKSTLLRLLIGALAPTAGRVTLDGRDLSAFSARTRAQRLAYVAQRPSLAAAFTVRETVALGRFASARRDPERGATENTPRRPDDPVARALAAVDLADRAGDLFQTLSVGQQQRAALARALCQLDDNPHGSECRATQALIVDEPTAALDPRHALATMDLLRAARGTAFQGGTSSPPGPALPPDSSSPRVAVAALHDLTAARRFADDALVLTDRGEVAAFGPADATLVPTVLEPVFRVRFLEWDVPGAGQVAIIPAHPLDGR